MPSVNKNCICAGTLMIIDDDDICLSVITLLLQSDGYQILQTSGGEAAIKLLLELQPKALPSIVLADLRMPGLSGRELAAALRQHLPGAKLLAMSATPVVAEGYDGFIRKPFDVAALRAVLDGGSGAYVKAASDG